MWRLVKPNQKEGRESPQSDRQRRSRNHRLCLLLRQRLVVAACHARHCAIARPCTGCCVQCFCHRSLPRSSLRQRSMLRQRSTHAQCRPHRSSPRSMLCPLVTAPTIPRRPRIVPCQTFTPLLPNPILQPSIASRLP